MAYTSVKDRQGTQETEKFSKFRVAPFTPQKQLISTAERTAQSTPQVVKPTPKPTTQRFKIGEGLPDTTRVLPGPRVSTAEALRRGERIEYIPVGERERISPQRIAREVALQPYTPVGVRVKIPFTQKGFTLPGDAVGHLTKDILESPEKLIKSAYFLGLSQADKEAFKIKDETKIIQSPLYQKDYKAMVDAGVNPVGAFVLTGINAAVDALIFADFIAKPIISRIVKIPVTRATIAKLTWEDISKITRGKVLSNEKMAAFYRTSQDGIDWAKTLKKSGNKIEVKVSEGKTLSQWLDEQYKVLKTDQAGHITMGVKKRAVNAIDDTIKGFEKRMSKTTDKTALKRLDKGYQEAIKRRQQILAEPVLTKDQGGFAKIPGKEPTITDDIAKAKGKMSFEEFAGSKEVYHGSPTELKQFDNKKGGAYFTDNYADATGFAGTPDNVYAGSLNFKKPLKIDAKGAKWDELNTKYGKSTQEVISNAQKDGYDGVVFKNIVDNIADTADMGQSTIYYAYKPQNSFLNESQLKQLWDRDALGVATGVQPDEEGKLKFSPVAGALGLGAGKLGKRGVSKKVPSSVYKNNRIAKKGFGLGQDTKAMLAAIKLGTDKYLGAVSTRLGNINPELKRGLRTFEFNIRSKTLKDTESVKPLLDATKKMTKDDKADFDLARKNGDKEMINEIVDKYGIRKEYNTVRKTLDDLYERADKVGYNINYLDNYSPRMIKDKVGFLNYFQKGKDWPIINQAIKAKENALQRSLNEEEKITLINTMIRGYQQNNITLSEIGNMKSREVDMVDADLNQFYMDSNASLVRYIDKANEAIEARKFFGKGRFGEDVDINDSIGAYVLDLLSKGKITPEQEIIVSDILKARFNPVSTRGPVTVYKNLSYIDTMGSITSAITQIGDLAWPLYKAGIFKTAKNAVKASVGKATIKREDIGIENIAQEFEDPGKTAKAVSTVFKLTGLEKIDKVGKETLISSVIEKYQGWAKKGNPKLDQELEKVFGKETEQVKADLIAGDLTENVKLLAFNELLDMQPIALSEMPQKYLTGGNGRIFYMLKTFTLKQFDIYRREIFQQIAKKGTRLKGLKNLMRLVSFFVIMNATADEIKDLVLGRKTSLKDRTVDNILRAVGFSKYLTWKVRTEGLGSGVARQILPPFKFIDSVTKDITQGIENGSEVLQSVPLGGKLYYWWFGKGAYKNEKRNKPTTKLEDIEKRIEKVQNSTKLKDYEDRIKKIQGI